MVDNIVLCQRVSRAVKHDIQTCIQRNISIIDNFKKSCRHSKYTSNIFLQTVKRNIVCCAYSQWIKTVLNHLPANKKNDIKLSQIYGRIQLDVHVSLHFLSALQSHICVITLETYVLLYLVAVVL